MSPKQKEKPWKKLKCIGEKARAIIKYKLKTCDFL
jgi:hypothetical protein